MTITNEIYYNKIISSLRKDNIVERLDKRENSTKWAYNK